VSFWRVAGLGGLDGLWVRGLGGAALLGAALLGGNRAEAQSSEAGASPTPGPPLSIWYRSSEGCPEGSVFVARLAELGRRATLAKVGDRVDFVVTVAAAPISSSGRLERQTARGTVAIRELQAPHCEEVTEALALSLEIALDPANEAPSAASPTAATPVELATTDRSSDRPAGAAAAPASASERRGALQLGAQGSLAKGIAPGWAPGGAVFAELRSNDPQAAAWALAGRLSLGAAIAADTVATIDVDVLWLAGRAEGCAFELRSGPLSLQPCAGAELGLLRAGSSGGAARTDTGFWGAGVGLLRASLALDERLTLEAQVGAALPFVRYAVGSSLGGNLFRTEPVILALGVGGRWAP